MRKADNLPPSCVVVTKSGNLNFLETSGPVQACNGTALLYFTFTSSFYDANISLSCEASNVLPKAALALLKTEFNLNYV